MTTDLTSSNHSNYWEHWLYDQRMLWPGQFKYREQYELAQKIEENLLKFYDKPILQRYMEDLLRFANANLDMDIEVLEINGYQRNYKILLPHTSGVMSIIKADPTTVAIFGDRKGGKTTTSWNIAWELYNALKETKEGVEVHVFGDVDAITQSLQLYSRRAGISPEIVRFANVVEEHRDYEMPEITGRNQIIIYNEVGESTSSKRGMAKENLEIVLRSLRVRHERRWMIHNIIRPQTVDITLREAPIKIIHHCTQDNMASIENTMRDPQKPIAWRTSALRPGQAIAIYSLLGYQASDKIYTTAIDFYEPHPPGWLMDVIQAGKSLEIQHADEIEFMKPRGEGKQSKMPKGDVINDQAFILYVKSIRENYPRVKVENIYHFMIDWQVKHIPKYKARLNNHVDSRTIDDLIDKGFIQFPRNKSDPNSYY
jgi:hypothetical protein